MSDYYQYRFQFQISDEMPAAARKALKVLSEGQAPSPAELDGLPGMVVTYLRGGGMPGDGVQAMENGLLSMTQTFQDDEFWNGGIYFVWWLLQFAEFDGPVGTLQQMNGLDMPEVLVKQGDLLITAALEVKAGTTQPTGAEPLRGAEGPVQVSSQKVESISKTLEELALFKDDYDYD